MTTTNNNTINTTVEESMAEAVHKKTIKDRARILVEVTRIEADIAKLSAAAQMGVIIDRLSEKITTLEMQIQTRKNQAAAMRVQLVKESKDLAEIWSADQRASRLLTPEEVKEVKAAATEKKRHEASVQKPFAGLAAMIQK